MTSTWTRVGVFVAGMALIAFGVAITAKTTLGANPIASIPYSLSLCFQALTFGMWMIVFNLMLIGLEVLVLRGKIALVNVIIQIALSFGFGYALDFFGALIAPVSFDTYALKIAACVVGCFFVALGACLGIFSRISVLPGDGLVVAIAAWRKKEVGKVRLFSDITMVACAAVIGLVFAREMSGVREGTIIAAIITGWFVLLLMRGLRKLRRPA